MGHPLEAVKSKLVRSGDSLWLEAGVSEMQRRMDQLNRCLVGWWGDSKVPDPKLDCLRRWVKFQWPLRRSLKIAVLGSGLMLFEFETVREAK